MAILAPLIGAAVVLVVGLLTVKQMHRGTMKQVQASLEAARVGQREHSRLQLQLSLYDRLADHIDRYEAGVIRLSDQLEVIQVELQLLGQKGGSPEARRVDLLGDLARTRDDSIVAVMRGYDVVLRDTEGLMDALHVADGKFYQVALLYVSAVARYLADSPEPDRQRALGRLRSGENEGIEASGLALKALRGARKGVVDVVADVRRLGQDRLLSEWLPGPHQGLPT